jgi:hypothetical protein
MEGYSTAQFTNRTAGTACQAQPHRPAELLLHRPWDDCSSAPAPQPHQARDPQASMISTRPVCLRPARLMLHRPTRSLLGPCPSALPGLWSTDSQDLHQAYTLGPPGKCSTGLPDHCNEMPLPAVLWGPTHLPPASGRPQSCLGDTDRED